MRAFIGQDVFPARSTMQNFVYAMNGSAPAPASGGTTKSWFFHYKWDVGGEAFVPVPVLAGEMPKSGDLIWFVMDKHPIGYAPVVRTQEDPMNDCVEVYYDTQEIRAGSIEDTTFSCEWPTGMASGSAARFLGELKRMFDSKYPKRAKATPPPVPEVEPEDETA